MIFYRQTKFVSVMNRVLYLTIDLVFGGVVEPVLYLTLHFTEFIEF